jgi:hypothetical protein
MVFGALAVLGGLGGVLGMTGHLMQSLANMPNVPSEARDALLQSTGRTWMNLPSLVLGALMLVGGLKMKNLQSYALALTAAIIALIPCLNGCCCVFSMPVGVWALYVLSRPEVKGAFTK